MNHVWQKDRLFRIFAAPMAPFLLILSAQIALGQGFKMTLNGTPFHPRDIRTLKPGRL